MTRHARHGPRLLAAAALAAVLASGAALAEVRTPIDACTTIDQPGSYVLTRNITASGDCIMIATDHVTIDLNGFAIMGDGTGHGIWDGTVFFLSDIAVRNGTIANFDSGISLDSTRHCSLHDLQVLNNGDGILVDGACTIGNNVTFGSGNLGIFAVASTSAGAATLISGNISRGSALTGVEARSFSVMAGNIVAGHSRGMSGRLGSLVTGNAINDNTDVGILQFSKSSTDPGALAVTNNAVTANGIGLDVDFNDALPPGSDIDGVLATLNTIRANPGGDQVGNCVECTMIHNAGIADSP